jgi:hypothetical protein
MPDCSCGLQRLCNLRIRRAKLHKDQDVCIEPRSRPSTRFRKYRASLWVNLLDYDGQPLFGPVGRAIGGKVQDKLESKTYAFTS